MDMVNEKYGAERLLKKRVTVWKKLVSKTGMIITIISVSVKYDVGGPGGGVLINNVYSKNVNWIKKKQDNK